MTPQFGPEQRILDSIKKHTGKQLVKDQKLPRERDRAIAATIHALYDMNHDVLCYIFARFESAGTGSQRKLTQTHPLRPDDVDAIVAKVNEARAKATEEAKALRAAEKAEKEREEYERLKAKFEGNGEEASVTEAPNAEE